MMKDMRSLCGASLAFWQYNCSMPLSADMHICWTPKRSDIILTPSCLILLFNCILSCRKSSRPSEDNEVVLAKSPSPDSIINSAWYDRRSPSSRSYNLQQKPQENRLRWGLSPAVLPMKSRSFSCASSSPLAGNPGEYQPDRRPSVLKMLAAKLFGRNTKQQANNFHSPTWHTLPDVIVPPPPLDTELVGDETTTVAGSFRSRSHIGLQEQINFDRNQTLANSAPSWFLARGNVSKPLVHATPFSKTSQRLREQHLAKLLTKSVVGGRDLSFDTPTFTDAALSREGDYEVMQPSNMVNSGTGPGEKKSLGSGTWYQSNPQITINPFMLPNPHCPDGFISRPVSSHPSNLAEWSDIEAGDMPELDLSPSSWYAHRSTEPLYEPLSPDNSELTVREAGERVTYDIPGIHCKGSSGQTSPAEQDSTVMSTINSGDEIQQVLLNSCDQISLTKNGSSEESQRSASTPPFCNTRAGSTQVYLGKGVADNQITSPPITDKHLADDIITAQFMKSSTAADMPAVSMLYGPDIDAEVQDSDKTASLVTSHTIVDLPTVSVLHTLGEDIQLQDSDRSGFNGYVDADFLAMGDIGDEEWRTLTSLTALDVAPTPAPRQGLEPDSEQDTVEEGGAAERSPIQHQVSSRETELVYDSRETETAIVTEQPQKTISDDTTAQSAPGVENRSRAVRKKLERHLGRKLDMANPFTDITNVRR